jgi:hypothetical protein
MAGLSEAVCKGLAHRALAVATMRLTQREAIATPMESGFVVKRDFHKLHI